MGVLLPACAGAASDERADGPAWARFRQFLNLSAHVKGGLVEPHWMPDGSSFWYAEEGLDRTTIWQVDPRSNDRRALFEVDDLRAALGPMLEEELPGEGLPFEELALAEDGRSVRLSVGGRNLIYRLDTRELEARPTASGPQESARAVPRAVEMAHWPGDETPPMEVESPDGRWIAGLREGRIWLRATEQDATVRLTDLSDDGYDWDLWGARWSPDSSKLALFKTAYKALKKNPIVDFLAPQPEIEWVYSFQEPFEAYQLFIVDVASKKQSPVVTTGNRGDEISLLGWTPDGSELLFWKTNLASNRIDLVAAAAQTGSTRTVLTERSETYLSILWERSGARFFHLLEDGERFLWMSDRDGWRHLSLHRMDGTLVHRLTAGEFPVVGVAAIDEPAGWVYFTAHGDRARPYDTHLYRVRLTGGEIERLTEAKGQHQIQFAPSRDFFLDTHSTVDRPPTVEMRRADGELLSVLSKARLDDGLGADWPSPDEFSVKAADGETDLYGVLYRPPNFDPNRRYPVIDILYAGHRVSMIPKTFSSFRAYMAVAPALAQLGFVTFVVDARGTPERGRAFQDVAHTSGDDHVLPDHVAALRGLAADRPFMDLDRVGVVGHSTGGYFALRALLRFPEVYHVGVASAAHHVKETARLGVQSESATEQRSADLLPDVPNLRGKLLLIYGTSDTVVPLSSYMRIADALITADKSFDTLLMPGQGHSLWRLPGSRDYWHEAIGRYFLAHLQP